MAIAESSKEPGYGEESDASALSYPLAASSSAHLSHSNSAGSFHRQSSGYPQQRTQL
jgi:hypothetical protein